MGQARTSLDLNLRSADYVPQGEENLYQSTSEFAVLFDARLAAKTTSNLSEGSNLYYTAARFLSSLNSRSTSDLPEGANLYYTAGRFNTAFLARQGTAQAWTAVQTFSSGINLPLAAYTADDESAAYTGIATGVGGTPYAAVTDLNALRVAYENLRAQVESIRTNATA